MRRVLETQLAIMTLLTDTFPVTSTDLQHLKKPFRDRRSKIQVCRALKKKKTVKSEIIH